MAKKKGLTATIGVKVRPDELAAVKSALRPGETLSELGRVLFADLVRQRMPLLADLDIETDAEKTRETERV